MNWYRPLGLALLAGCINVAPLHAQTALQWTTNYYSVTGATLGEIRQSIRQSRPWKDRLAVDGFTDWRVNWRFSVMPIAGGCRCSSFSTQTTIVTTLPLWTPPTNALDSVIRTWTNYIVALGRHEAGHAQMALAAGAELHRRARELGAGTDCDSLKATLTGLGEKVVAEYRQQDKEYDERTRHGATQGATLPGRSRRRR